MESINLVQSTADSCISITGKEGDIIALYVDNLIIIAKTPEALKK